MNRFVAALVMLLMAGSAFAADEAAQGSNAAGSSTTFNWTGFYMGGNVELGRSQRSSLTTNTTNGLATATSKTVNGVVGGVQAGVNFKAGATWVVSIEGDVDGSSLSETVLGYNAAGVNIASTTAKTKAIGTVRGGLGHTWNRMLLDVAGGLAWHDIQGSRTQLVGQVNNAPAGTVEDTSYTSAGWTLGAGLHVGLVRHWAAQAEYLYLHFTHTDTTPLSLLATTSTASTQAVRIGVSYLFK